VCDTGTVPSSAALPYAGGFWRLTRVCEQLYPNQHLEVVMAPNFLLQFNGDVAQHDVDLDFVEFGLQTAKI
jgi:hypothetical protein